MCGIAGIFNKKPKKDLQQDVDNQVRDILSHRGPDDYGSWSDHAITLHHWRLSILDLTDAGHQPMWSHCGRYVIVFNGEIYNFPELREDLGRQFRIPWRSRSDTEVILEGFARLGNSFLTELNGMFALAIYDIIDSRLLVARDRMGIKPLYLYETEDKILFASEAKFFTKFSDYKVQVNRDGLSAYFTYGHSVGGQRIIEGLTQLTPGCFLTIATNHEKKLERYTPLPCWRKCVWTDEKAIDEIRKLLPKVVERQLISDVPVGVLLSSGVDSSILTALAARILGPKATKAFTLAYPGSGTAFDEFAEAQTTARYLGVTHYSREATPDDLISEIASLVWHYDEPFADAAALNTILICKLVRKHVTVALAGEGSDELFGGYRRYQSECMARKFPFLSRTFSYLLSILNPSIVGNIPRRVSVLLRSLEGKKPETRYSAYFESGVDIKSLIRSKWHSSISPRAVLGQIMLENTSATPIAQLCLADQRFWLPDTYLEKSDKGSMSQSLEMRVPFLDNQLVEFANSLPDRLRIKNGVRKWLLKEAFRDMFPKGTLDRPKRGFGVPISDWMRGILGEYFASQVLGPDARSIEYLNTSVVEKMLQSHRASKSDNHEVLWQILIFEHWLRRFEVPTRKAL